MNKSTQHQRIREYIAEHGSITPMEAWNELGISKLSTRINEMIRNGEDYQKHMNSCTNRYGETIRYMTYYGSTR